MRLDEGMVARCDEAITKMTRGHIPEAIQEFTAILSDDKTIDLAWNNRGLGLLQLGHPFDAILNIEKALELKPESGEYHLNLGAAYSEMEEMDKAIECYRKTIELNPKISHAQMNLGNALKWRGDVKPALEAYRKAVEIDPNYVDAHLNKAFTELLVGNYKDGWEEFEWRWKSNQLVERGLPLPQWNGENLEGKTLLIYGEQGFGDVLQFVRYARMVKEKFGGHVILEVRQPLTRLMKSVRGVDEVLTFGDQVPVERIAYCIPVMSLPRIFGTTLETIPWHGPYFKADPSRMEIWRKALKQLPPGLLVGICWAGMSRTGKPQAEAVDKKRSTTLSSFAPLAEVNGVSWVSLQKGNPRDQVKTPPRGMTIGDWTDELDDFYDTAALIECLDLVITVDTAVVHLAAALGKPTWLLSRWDGCWRWLGNRSDSPWYPTLRQFTQPKPNDWPSMMQEAADALQKLVINKALAA